jgi:hypothetical protein
MTETKNEKPKGKRQRLGTQKHSDIILSASNGMSCGQLGHVNAKSKECQNYRPALNEFLNNRFGGQFECFTRKGYFKFVIKLAYQNSFVDKIIKLSEFIRNVVFCVLKKKKKKKKKISQRTFLF